MNCGLATTFLFPQTFSQDGLWSSLRDIVIHEATLTPETDLGEHKKFHLVTLPHVIYYAKTAGERRGLLDLLQRHLLPGGVIWILLMARADDSGRDNQHLMLYKDLRFEKPTTT